MQQLTGLDAAFLAMETRTTYGHVGSVQIVDPTTAPQPLTLESLTRVLESRLALVPALRRRLVEVPLGLDQPYWIEDPDFDIEFHVRELGLAAPGTDRQLVEQVARLHARPLDRTRPLWEIYLISGLESGRIAIYNKVHHAAIDGVAGNEILAALLDHSPEGRQLPDLPPPAPEQPPSPVELVVRSAASLVGHPMRAVRLAAGLLRAAPTLVTTTAPRLPLVGRLLDGDGDLILSQPGLRAPDTPFNRPITQHRRWAFCEVPLSGAKKIKNSAGLTVNDVIMALCAGALRRWLADHDALPDTPLNVAVPVSVRADAEKEAAGNRVSMMFTALPTELPDPVDRMRAVHQANLIAKEQHGAIPASALADVAQFTAPALAGQAWRLSARLRLMQRVKPFNLIISNVPGPNIPLYIAGAELIAYYPLSAIVDGQGLNITVFSYRDSIFFGLLACRELVPDLDKMARYIVEEFDVLTAAADRAGG